MEASVEMRLKMQIQDMSEVKMLACVGEGNVERPASTVMMVSMRGYEEEEKNGDDGDGTLGLRSG